MTISVYDLVGAPLCRIALYCFRDAVYCETTNARERVKLHVRNSRTLQLDKNTDTRRTRNLKVAMSTRVRLFFETRKYFILLYKHQ